MDNRKLRLYKFETDYSDAWFYGLFIATEDDIKEALNKYLYLSEVAGKHSDVEFKFDSSQITELVVSDLVIDDLLEANSNNKTLVGYNPLTYVYDKDLCDAY